MESALALPNDNIIVAAVETLCFWTFECKNIGIDRPASVLRNWLANPTTKNIAVVNICKQISESSLTGFILRHFVKPGKSIQTFKLNIRKSGKVLQFLTGPAHGALLARLNEKISGEGISRVMVTIRRSKFGGFRLLASISKVNESKTSPRFYTSSLPTFRDIRSATGLLGRQHLLPLAYTLQPSLLGLSPGVRTGRARQRTNTWLLRYENYMVHYRSWS